MILMYHNIGSQPGFNTVSEANFAEQIHLLAAQNYKVVDLDTYVKSIQTRQPLKHQVVITFDDAYQSFQDMALPILHRHTFHATVFVPTQFVGLSNQWDQDHIPIMDWNALRALSRHPRVGIGSHGMSHRRMRELTTEQISQEATQSKEVLERELNVQVRHFSYPFGQLCDLDGRCKQLVREAGYQSACSTLWGRSNSSAHLFALHRIEIEPQDDLRRFSAKISRTLHPRYFRQRAKNWLYRMHLRR
jgi:peptidoglycan/xylan/chitin deacetylase (PgdA/CDA1 family)